MCARIIPLRYAIQRGNRLEKAGRVAIFRAADPCLNRLVAVKVSTADDHAADALFLREAEVFAKLADTGIPSVYNQSEHQ